MADKPKLNPLGRFVRSGSALLDRLPGVALDVPRRGINELTYMANRIAAGQTPYAPTTFAATTGQQFGPPVPERLLTTTPIVRGIDQAGGVDRRQSDTYKQYAQTPEGQFQRYFQSPEMDRFFGAASRGTGAPGSLEAMQTLASQAKAPTDSPLAAYYRAQSAAGRGAMPEVVGGLTQGLEGEQAKAMEAWAKANPMLAYREFNKRFPAGEPTIGPTPAALQADESLKGVTQFFPGAEPGGFAPGVGNPVVPTENRNAAGMTQGEQMDLNRGAPVLRAYQAEKTSGESMPSFETTLDRSRGLLGRIGVQPLF